MLNNKKAYYSIREVCSITGLEPHVLRYWESEFPRLRPKKNRAGNRAYREKDIETIKTIKHLLYSEKYTIPGAKKKLADPREHDAPLDPPPEAPAKTDSNGDLLRDAVNDLKSVLDMLRSDVPTF